MTAFKVGDIVAKTGTAVVIEEGTSDWPSARIRWPNGVEEWASERDYALVESGLADSKPSWNDVEVGDTVKVKVIHTGEVFEVLVTESTPDYPAGRGRFVLGLSVDATLVEDCWELLSITKPKPALPTKPGSVIRLHNSGHTVFAHRREHRWNWQSKQWVSDGGSMYSDAEVEECGWEVVE